MVVPSGLTLVWSFSTQPRTGLALKVTVGTLSAIMSGSMPAAMVTWVNARLK